MTDPPNLAGVLAKEDLWSPKGKKKPRTRVKVPQPGQMRWDLVSLRYDDLPAEATVVSQVLDLYTDEELGTVERLVLNESIRSTAGIERCPNLVELNLGNNPLLEDLTGVSTLVHLEGLSIGGWPSAPISDLSDLGTLRKLRSFSISQTQVSDLSMLEPFQDLEALRIGQTPITELALPQLPKLAWIQMLRCTQLKRLEGIEGLPALNRLEFYDTFEETAGGIVEITSATKERLLSGEIALGVMPDDSEQRAFLDTLKVIDPVP